MLGWSCRTRPGDTLIRLQAGVDQLEVRGLPRVDAERLLGRWLKNAGRTLRAQQRAHVLSAFDRSAGNPLYLKLAFEEARWWASDTGQPPDQLAVGLGGLIRDNVFGRLAREDQHGKVLVSRALGYLAASRYGLAEDDLLSRDIDAYAWFLGHTLYVPSDLRELVPLEVIEASRRDPARREELRARLRDVLSRPDGPPGSVSCLESGRGGP